MIIYDLDFTPARILLSNFATNTALSLEWVRKMSIDPDSFYSQVISLLTNERTDDSLMFDTSNKKTVQSKEPTDPTPIMTILPGGANVTEEATNYNYDHQYRTSPLTSSNRQELAFKMVDYELPRFTEVPKAQSKAQAASPTTQISPSPLRRSTRRGNIRKENQNQVSPPSPATLSRKRRVTAPSPSSDDDALFQPPSPVSEPDW
jgi:hypothetical protein